MDKKVHRRIREKQMWAQRRRAVGPLAICYLRSQPASGWTWSHCMLSLLSSTYPSTPSSASWTAVLWDAQIPGLFRLLGTNQGFAGARRRSWAFACCLCALAVRLTTPLSHRAWISCLQPIWVAHWRPERAVRRIELVRSRGEIKEARNKKLSIGWCVGSVGL